MLKHLALALFCLFALMSACDPNPNEPFEPTPTPPSEIITDPDETVEEPQNRPDSLNIIALAEINAWRTSGCDCGDAAMPTVDTLTFNSTLHEAALAHAKDMNKNSYFNHTSPSGENIYHRLVKFGYITSSVAILSYGENLAFGDLTHTTAIERWLESPSHCANIMRASHREMAVARDGNYWVQVFGAKRTGE